MRNWKNMTVLNLRNRFIIKMTTFNSITHLRKKSTINFWLMMSACKFVNNLCSRLNQKSICFSQIWRPSRFVSFQLLRGFVFLYDAITYLQTQISTDEFFRYSLLTLSWILDNIPKNIKTVASKRSLLYQKTKQIYRSSWVR